MFKIEKNEKQLSFSLEKENSLFGDGSKIIFWVDLELQGMQRGRQEFIPLSTISRFTLNGNSISCDLNGSEMKLYEGNEDELVQIIDVEKVMKTYSQYKKT